MVAAASPAEPMACARLAAMQDPVGGHPEPEISPAIGTDRLTKHYGSVHALNGLTLEVRRGEIFGFLGPNGAGKSTLIRTLLGFLHPTSGGARVLGLEIGAQSVEIRSRTGYLPGGIALYGSLTGADALTSLSDLQGQTPT